MKGIVSDDPFVRKLEARVREAKKRDDWRREFMTLSMWEREKFEEGRSQGLSQGLSQGRREGRQETWNAAAAFMKENGIPVELISKFKNSLTESWA